MLKCYVQFAHIVITIIAEIDEILLTKQSVS